MPHEQNIPDLKKIQESEIQKNQHDLSKKESIVLDQKIPSFQQFSDIEHSIQKLTSTEIKLKFPIYLSRHGESEGSILQTIGGDCDLTQKGVKYSQQLSEWIQNQKESQQNGLQVYTSQLKRTLHTAEVLNQYYESTPLSYLNEINAGEYENMTFSEVKEKYPDFYQQRQTQKFSTQYPQGESYTDLVERVGNVIDLINNSEKPILLISHQAITRVLLAYFLKLTDMNKMPEIEIPFNLVIKLTQNQQGIFIPEYYKLTN